MNENQKKAFDFAADITKQLIVLSTGIITLTVTFSKDIIGLNGVSKSLLVFTWGIFILSICFGIMTLMALTGTLLPMKDENKIKDDDKSKSDEIKPDSIKSDEIKSDETKPDNPQNKATNADSETSINKGNIRFLSMCQILSFLLALIMTVVYGYKSLSTTKQKENHRNQYMIIRESRLGNDTTKYVDTLYLSK